MSTTRYLEAQQAKQRNYQDFLIVDVDSHHYETERFKEIIPYIEDPVLRQLAKSSEQSGRGNMFVSQPGSQDMGGETSLGRMWSNWAGDQRCEPAAIERPAGVGEVVGAVERAVAAGRCVRVAGSGHSFAAAALTDGTLLSLDRMGALLDADTSSGLVRVEAGIRLHALSHALADMLPTVDGLQVTAISTQRAKLGASQNRLEHTINSINVSVENLTASESRIRDTDMAQEMMSFTRSQILSQAGTAMLGQANQASQGVLSLLR